MFDYELPHQMHEHYQQEPAFLLQESRLLYPKDHQLNLLYPALLRYNSTLSHFVDNLNHRYQRKQLPRLKEYRSEPNYLLVYLDIRYKNQCLHCCFLEDQRVLTMIQLLLHFQRLLQPIQEHREAAEIDCR